MNVTAPSSAFRIQNEIFGAERAVIARCLAEPTLIPQAASLLSPQDFQQDFLADCFKMLVSVYDEGRKPSLETLISFFGDEEVEGGLSARNFLTDLLRGSLWGQFLPIEDAIDVIRDTARRNLMGQIGDGLSRSVTSPSSVVATASDAALRLDELIASCRRGERQTFDSSAIAAVAFEHLDGADPADPTTGLKDLDDVLGGWPKGQLSVLAARPGMGKSAFAISSLLRAAKAGHGCLFFSLEMTKKQISARMLTDLAFTRDNPIFYEDILKRHAIDDRRRARLLQAGELLKKFPLTIEVERGLTVTDVAVRSRKFTAQQQRAGTNLEVIFVDHMLLLRASQRYAGNRVREVAEISDGLASLAKELNVAVVALCQLNRSVEAREVKRPNLSDLRDSGAIEEDASTVTFLYRPAYYIEQTKAEGEAELKRMELLDARRNDLEFIVAKNRNGRIGIVDAYVNIGANAVRAKSYGRAA